MTGRRIAVIGGGISGLTAGYVLSRTDQVTLFEADRRLGGHADTHLVGPVPVDTGFIVYNERTYPLLTRLLAELGVSTRAAEMSMSVRCAGCGLHYAGHRGPGGLAAGLRRGGGRFLHLLADVPRFHRAARRLLAGDTPGGPLGDARGGPLGDTPGGPLGDAPGGLTFGEFLTDGGYSGYFQAHFALPLVAAVWSCPAGTALRYPARYLFAFLANHGMLSVMVLHRPREFFRRFGASGLIGFGESYLAGDWDCADLTGLLTVFAAHAADLIPPGLQRLRTLAVRRRPPGDRQTRDGARRNIGRHYDLSNELFALFLDETMTYSSALFTATQGGVPLAADHLLADAQRRKIDCLLDRAGAGPGCRLLEVGTGWGELAIRAARRGASVVTVTISREQQAYAARQVAEAGLAGRVRVELRDYRDLEGTFDAICSCEMIEAVGERYWDAYFTALDRHLAPGGRIGLQTITMPHDRMLATRHTCTWIQKYIFPGGLLPSLTAIENSLTSQTRLRITARTDFGPHYAETLKIWRHRFQARADDVARLGFDDVFTRMWTFYLCYSEAGFRSGYIDVSQLTLARI